jgi:SAM-dependent methyltransferase
VTEPGPLRIRVTRVDESWEIAPELFDHFAFESGDELTILPEAAAAALLRTPDGCANIRTATGSAIRVPTRFDLFLFRGLRIPVYLIELTGAGADTLDHLGKAHMDNYRKFVGLSSGMSILDIGCGIGRDALQFLDILDSGGGYLGIDMTRDSIVWCRREISSRYPNFYFHHFDAANEVYNPLGRQSSSDFSIPAADKSIDRILLASVFTHLFEDEVQHYLNEFKRVLRLDGLIYASFFLYSEETLAAAKVSGKTPWKATFEHTLGRGFFANDPVYPRGAVAITDEAMRRMITESGLRLTRPYLKGWWSGLYEHADDGQDVAIIGL